MPKRRSDRRDGRRTAKRRVQHLYLIFDDWHWGYSIRKVDLSSDIDSDDEVVELPLHVSGDGTIIGASINRAVQLLSEPIFRLEAPTGSPQCFAAALGTKIIALHSREPEMRTRPLGPFSSSPVIDVVDRSLTFIPQPKVNILNPICFPIGDSLFALSSGSFRLLTPTEVEEPRGSRCGSSLVWRKLPRHPFKRFHVTSYTVHRDGRTIFVSTSKGVTFTFDTSGPHFQWKQRDGKWALPFTGRAYYSRNLNAWVGISGDPDKKGYLCACDVVAPNNSDGSTDELFLAPKVSKEKLFSVDPAEVHVGASLVYMGGRSRFCLVQCVCVEDEECDNKRNFYKNRGLREDSDDEEGTCSYFLRLTSFSLKFNKDGDLTTGNSRRVRYYQVPEAASEFSLDDPVAFWL